MAMNWCNLSAPWLRVGRLRIRLWNLFNRRSTEGHWWGVGLLQIGQRHLLFVGHCGVRALFVGETP
ncbi:MAG: hypothetical protein ACRDI2_23790 [Chloroflexota bacterium]